MQRGNIFILLQGVQINLQDCILSSLVDSVDASGRQSQSYPAIFFDLVSMYT